MRFFASLWAFGLGAVLLAAAAAAQPQDTTRTREVQILNADSLSGGVVGGERVQQLVGNVLLRQDSTWLRARRALRYLDRNEILFTGAVRIIDKRDTLWADRVVYDRLNKVGRAHGNVRLSDGEVRVTAPSGIYYTREKRAVFDAGVRLVDSTAVLESRTGAYWTEEKRAEFAGEVHLDEPRSRLRADSVTYHRETEVSLARGHVFIERLGEDADRDGGQDDGQDEAAADSTLRTLLFGDRAYHDERAGFSRIEGRPLLVQLRRDDDAPADAAGVDTLLIRAVVLEATRVDSLQRLVALDSVRVWRRDLAAVADSVVYDRIRLRGEAAREEARLFKQPVAWFEQSQVSGDTLRVLGRGGAVDTLRVRGNAFVAQQDTVLNRIQQLRGRHLTAAFRDDSLRTLLIGPNAESIFYRADDDDQPAGAVQTSADRITFYFEGGEVARISAVRGIEGTYYPEDQLPSPFQLDGFRWMPERRPERAALLGPVEIPVPAVEAAPPPVLPEAPVQLPTPASEAENTPEQR